MYVIAPTPAPVADFLDVAEDVFKGAKGLYDSRIASQAREQAYKDLFEQRGGTAPGVMSKYGLPIAAAGVGLVLVLVLTKR